MLPPPPAGIARALLVVDVQEDYTGPDARKPFPYPDADRVIDVLNGLIEAAAGKGVPVVLVRQEFSGWAGRLFSYLFSGNTGRPGTPGVELDRRLRVGSSPVFVKHVADAFTSLELVAFLRSRGIGQVVVTGLDAQYCVHATARGGLKHGYRITVVTDAILLLAARRRNSVLERFRRSGVELRTASNALE
jgi:nicotinamidase/pyrazinamidase